MDAIYPYALVVHLFCAVVFVGYLFFDVVIMPLVMKKLPNGQEARKANESVAGKIMPWVVFVIILTGGMMMTRWVNSDIGYFETGGQKLFMLKVLLGFIIFAMILINKIFKIILKKPSPLGNIHPHALIASIIIIIIAKSFIYVG
ncbi:copper resistance protein CopD [Campylobacter corcagiensis]|uniref:Copper resistance protein CopD n=1 Tax=Campylobacter corcagiensis TaxID=1448857 RepID=A0A7M1LJB0_9BACT|nr:copper resistance protein CopD [Campylobacter corcagiensis]QKF64200.1 putative membrane protein [Campylobacter corcagiensis]QOQ87605.1 copper resistance protein CopD [Campylobacter corcagiensis]